MKKITLLILLSLFQYAFAHGTNKGIKVETVVKATKSWNGDKLPDYTKGKPQITILKITIAPHTKLPWHKHPYINAGVLLKGHLTVHSANNKVLKMKAGDPIVELVNKSHYGINEYDEPAVIMVFYAGELNKPVTVLDKTRK
ncbi:cupin [Malaciobacter molluscorum]|uniref:cupin domain-containing protein n=1 Tax=Malaciobacter molluscorum TaxID=1032072 RepID=UPI00100C0B6E|nr:cupin domain-containing protein [Malaciobacter molluscorum]RXJ97257.1 cupin [Malaciobacter molluscorum]